MDKPIVHPPVSNREDQFSGNYGEDHQSATVSREPSSRSSSMRDYTSSGNARSLANSLPKPALTHLSSARRGDILGVTDSGRSNRESRWEAESPRKSQSSSILNVGSKLLSRIKHAKAKTAHSQTHTHREQIHTHRYIANGFDTPVYPSIQFERY